MEALRQNRSTMDWKERITLDPDILVGKPAIRGMRISVELVLELLGLGWSYDELLENYPVLTREDIEACLLYASALVQDSRPYRLPADLPSASGSSPMSTSSVRPFAL
jgi:uncharacterized protein (DUF433 family)